MSEMNLTPTNEKSHRMFIVDIQNLAEYNRIFYLEKPLENAAETVAITSNYQQIWHHD